MEYLLNIGVGVTHSIHQVSLVLNETDSTWEVSEEEEGEVADPNRCRNLRGDEL